MINILIVDEPQPSAAASSMGLTDVPDGFATIEDEFVLNGSHSSQLFSATNFNILNCWILFSENGITAKISCVLLNNHEF